MREVSNISGFNCESGSQSQDGYVTELFGWEITNPPSKNRIDKNTFNFINKKVLLQDLFKQLSISFDEKYSPSGWTHYRCCPFPDHKDDSPSFHYNPEENRFWCFGCQRGGRAIQFLSFYKRIKKIAAAELLLKTLGSIDDINDQIAENTSEEVEMLLYEFSLFVRSFLHKHKTYSALTFIEKITWALDIYLYKHVPSSDIDFDNLKARISLLKEKILKYEKDINCG